MTLISYENSENLTFSFISLSDVIQCIDEELSIGFSCHYNNISIIKQVTAMEIFDESTLSEYEVLRQRNIIKNYEFMKSCGE